MIHFGYNLQESVCVEINLNIIQLVKHISLTKKSEVRISTITCSSNKKKCGGGISYFAPIWARAKSKLRKKRKMGRVLMTTNTYVVETRGAVRGLGRTPDLFSFSKILIYFVAFNFRPTRLSYTCQSRTRVQLNKIFS